MTWPTLRPGDESFFTPPTWNRSPVLDPGAIKRAGFAIIAAAWI
jgi:hypothetical protein